MFVPKVFYSQRYHIIQNNTRRKNYLATKRKANTFYKNTNEHKISHMQYIARIDLVHGELKEFIQRSENPKMGVAEAQNVEDGVQVVDKEIMSKIDPNLPIGSNL